MQMSKALFLSVFFATYALADIRIPQPLPKGPEKLKVIDRQVQVGHYIVKGPKYKSTAYIAQPEGIKGYLVYQYTGSTLTKGIGFMDGDTFVIGWEQEKTIGVTSIHFRDGKGRASWVSNPGTGQVGHETWSLIDEEE